MSLAFLAPLMLGGAALLVAPYLIHRIRRPEREPVRFSSLLFIPDVKKEVIERRRLQHILLMVTRMAILLLLALAFARPFAKAAMVSEVSDVASKHVILLDTSFSMAAADGFSAAVNAAEALLGNLTADDEVAVVAFAGSTEVLAPFASEMHPDGGTVSAARAALRTAALRDEATDYGAALREAQRLLLGESDSSDGGPRRIVHLISDLQRTGMPGPGETWKLSPSIELEAIGVGAGTSNNFAVADVIAKRSLTKEIRVIGKVKNWSGEDADVVSVNLVVDGETVETVEKPIRAGNATQFSFSQPVPESGVLAGYLELGDDGIAKDNRRYFVWSPPAKHDVPIVTARAAVARDPRNPTTWPSSWYIERGLPTGGEWPFATRTIDADAVSTSLDPTGANTSAAILSGTRGVTATEFDALREFASGGGAALVVLDSADNAAREFAESIGLDVKGMRYENTSPSRYELLTWVNLDHPVFAGFQGHLYNDFSGLRFHQYVELAEPAEDGGTVLAKFESGAPAMVEVAIGQGTLIVWPFAVELTATNLPKSSRFVPLLYETMLHLCRVEESESSWFVGDVLHDRDLVFDGSGRSVVTLPNEGVRTLLEPRVPHLPHRSRRRAC